MKGTNKATATITRVAIVGDEKARVIRRLARFGMRPDGKRPQAIISFGGDGTALRAEARYPGVPRLPIRNSPICNLCEAHDVDGALLRLSSGMFSIKRESTLEATLTRKGKTIARLRALNDINIHYVPPQALRVRVQSGGTWLIATRHQHDERTHTLHDVFIGDGVVVSTPHGSPGYFHSITRSHFTAGIGLAFNNPVHPAQHRVLGNSARVMVEIVRGPGILVADNMTRPVPLRDGDRIAIKKGARDARIITLNR